MLFFGGRFGVLSTRISWYPSIRRILEMQVESLLTIPPVFFNFRHGCTLACQSSGGGRGTYTRLLLGLECRIFSTLLEDAS